jgi:hypothetical protein
VRHYQIVPIRHTIVLPDPTDIFPAPRPGEAPAVRRSLSAVSWAAYAGPSRQREARWFISVAQEDATGRAPEGSITVVLVLLAVAMAVFIALMIAGYH